MKPTKTAQKELNKRMVKADAFVAQLARDLYVAKWDLMTQAQTNGGLAHSCMEAAVAYFEALQTFRKPPAPSYPLPPVTVAEALEEYPTPVPAVPEGA